MQAILHDTFLQEEYIIYFYRTGLLYKNNREAGVH